MPVSFQSKEILLMHKTAIITDTDSSLPVDLAKEYAIKQVPITIHFEDSSYTTGVDIDDRLLFEIIDQKKKLPTTSAPPPSGFASAYEEAFTAGMDSIVCICVSSKISATYNSAVTACEMFPGRDITVIDSMNLSMGQGFMALAAAEAAVQGASRAEVVDRAVKTGQHVHVFAVLSTLKYLAMSGRIGKLAAGMADTLNIKPILTVQDGKLDLLERIRTRKKAIERVLELTRSSVDGKTIERVAFVHAHNLEGAQELQSQLCNVLPCPSSIIMADFTPGLSVHAGAGVVGVVLLTS
jgi:DegV family protein with EDD domain